MSITRFNNTTTAVGTADKKGTRIMKTNNSSSNNSTSTLMIGDRVEVYTDRGIWESAEIRAIKGRRFSEGRRTYEVRFDTGEFFSPILANRIRMEEDEAQNLEDEAQNLEDAAQNMAAATRNRANKERNSTMMITDMTMKITGNATRNNTAILHSRDDRFITASVQGFETDIVIDRKSGLAKRAYQCGQLSSRINDEEMVSSSENLTELALQMIELVNQLFDARSKQFATIGL